MNIDKIEIQYFRSIYRETVSGLNLLNVFTGRNDVGKSNVLKALNLFFNNEVDPGVSFSFSDNFNLQRLEEVRRDSIKGKQYIQIKITFVRGNRFEKTLPKKFTVTKKWFRADVVPSVITDDIEKRLTAEGNAYNDRCRSSLTAFLNKIRYVYIPAIKDANTFSMVLAQLRETIYNDRLSNDDQIFPSMAVLANRIADAAQELNDEFESATGIKTYLSSPKSITELYQAIGVDTQADTYGNRVNLDKRGDGIRVRYLPSILYYIAKNSSNMYVWGFEEPENSLEYNLALKMAEDFSRLYCKVSQIFVTSHSPAFLGLPDGEPSILYRCYKENASTRIVALSQAKGREQLAEELGYIQIQQEVFALYRNKVFELDELRAQKHKLADQLLTLTKPVLYTEGKTDVSILEVAWRKLYQDTPRPFEIKSCNTLAEGAGSAAGCSVLRHLLETVRPDCPQVVIGLFDRDQAGMNAFSLDNNFTIIEDGWKQHKNKRSHALLLPVPPGKDLFAKYQNLCIEFYFEKADIDMRINGKGLVLIPAQIVQSFNGITVDKHDATEMHFQRIEGSTKSYFAENIVPTLPESSFAHFKNLFEKVLQIIQTQ